MKLIWIQEDERRKAQRKESAETDLPWLWILAATTSKPLLKAVGGVVKPDWMPGIYFLSDIFKTAIVAVDQLPATQETLWLRVLGRGETQVQEIREVLALPPDHPRRNAILRLLTSWKVKIELGEIAGWNEQENLMALSESFLAWEQQIEERITQRVTQEVTQRVTQEVTQKVRQEVKQEVKQEVRQEERKEIALSMLRKSLPLATIAEITGLTIAQLQQLQVNQSQQ